MAHRLVVAANLLGLPALSVPIGTSPDGLPQSVQLIGGRHQESLCLQFGAHIERAAPALTPIDPTVRQG
jgi:Asp-tRNA(Asn)/Glu-tRNA(Gln) amidotransferase A subunit family amidase